MTGPRILFDGTASLEDPYYSRKSMDDAFAVAGWMWFVAATFGSGLIAGYSIATLYWSAGL